MPIFMPEFEQDEKLISILAARVSLYWNRWGGTDYTVRAFVASPSVKIVSREGDEVLAAFFPEEPGPFKRLATLMVLAKLVPLFTLATPNSTKDNLKEVDMETEIEWLPRLCFLLIEPTFQILSLKGPNGKNTPMSHWNGFPSMHSKAEFLQWLEWIRDYSPEHLTQSARDENLVRRGRMILATSLILEAVYYQNEASKGGICGCCDHQLMEDPRMARAIVFDGLLQLNEQEGKTY